MKKIMGLMVGFMLICGSAYAGNGDLLVLGKLGIGTANPAAHFQISQGTADNYVDSNTGNLNIVSNSLVGYPAIGYNIASGNTGNTWRFMGADNASWIQFQGNRINFFQSTNAPSSGAVITPNPTITIDQVGNTGIGTANPGYKLHVGTDSAGKPSTNMWTIASDARLKQNIQPYTKGLNEIVNIMPVTYKYNGKGGIGQSKVKLTDAKTGESVETIVIDTDLLSKTNVGVIAQDIQLIVPEAITSHKAKIDENDQIETDILDFNSHPLTFIMINAIKELKAQIDSLNQQIAILKGGGK